jgi:hypothetical protein
MDNTNTVAEEYLNYATGFKTAICKIRSLISPGLPFFFGSDGSVTCIVVYYESRKIFNTYQTWLIIGPYDTHKQPKCPNTPRCGRHIGAEAKQIYHAY